MIADFAACLQQRPFQPFVAVTSAGQKYLVASPDHAHVHARRTRVVIDFDEGGGVVISAPHLAAIEFPDEAHAA